VNGGENPAKIARWNLKGKCGGKPGDNSHETLVNTQESGDNAELKRRRHAEESSCAFPKKYLLSY
jgi:hypothetical protein